MATHSSILAGKFHRQRSLEGGLQSMGRQRVRAQRLFCLDIAISSHPKSEHGHMTRLG